MKTGVNGLYLTILAFTAAVLFVEIQTPLGLTPWLLYLLPLGLTYWAPYLYAPLIIAALCTVLIAVGYFLSPPGVPGPVAMTNRAFGAGTFWVLGILILQYKILEERLSTLTKTLATELTERTRDLGLAVTALQTEVELRTSAERNPPEPGPGIDGPVTAGSPVERHQETIEPSAHAEQPEQEREAGLELTRDALVQLTHRLERLQRDLLQDTGDKP